MNTELITEEITYPESDGKPMAENTEQWDWMVKIVGELRVRFRGKRVFAAGDLFWYPVQGQPTIVVAPDAMVAFDRPPGFRSSYKQWEEDGIAPQVVFEVMSPSNTDREMRSKFHFYEKYGVEEYYVIDPDDSIILGYERGDSGLEPIARMNGFVSPRLEIKFVKSNGDWSILGPDGQPFRTREEWAEEIEAELKRVESETADLRERAMIAEGLADQLRKRAENEKARAETEKARADAERREKERLLSKLVAMGVEL